MLYKIYQKLNAIETKLDLLTRPPLSSHAVPVEDKQGEVETSESTVSSREEYVFKRKHLTDISLSSVGYHLSLATDKRLAILAKLRGSKEALLNHLYALWTVWQGKNEKYEQNLMEDICWVEEKYFT